MSRCIDAGREGCPCILAETASCLVCSKLAGGDCQECSWQGSCIYTLYEQNGRRQVETREERLLNIEGIRRYSHGFAVVILQADKGFCQRAATAGAYVFVRDETDRDWYGAPISVLKAEPELGRIHLGICSCGPKTVRIFQAADKFASGIPMRLCVRGVYYNGLSGLHSLNEKAEKTYIFGKGIALAPLRNFLDGGQRYAKYLKKLQCYIDLDKVGADFFYDYFGDLPAATVQIRNFARQGLCSLDDLDHLEECDDNVFALTSPYYTEQIQRAAGRGASLIRPTEGNMCCGEGICGACTYNDETGKIIRRCKDVR